MVTRKDIETGLRDIGLRRGDVVVVHSSLSSFGVVRGGADVVVDVLLSVLGDEGTLVAPTFNFEPGVFDPDSTPSIVGAVTEVVRQRPESIRSLHPTHSVAAIGPLAEAITEGHENTAPFGRGSALFKVLQANGKILQLGTDHATNSMVHVAEEIAEAPYLDRSRQVRVRTGTGSERELWVRRAGCSKGFRKLENVMRARGAVTSTFIGDCEARLMTARAVVDAATEILEWDNESLLCDRPDCESCAEARAMTAASASEAQDKQIVQMATDEERTRRIVERQLDSGEVNHFDLEGHSHSLN